MQKGIELLKSEGFERTARRAENILSLCTSAGVFNENGNGVIAPSAILDRASASQMIYNLIK